MIPVTHHRLLTRGDLHDSAGGLYNPGAWVDPRERVPYMVVRHEVDYTWTQPCYATFLGVMDTLTTVPAGAKTVPFVGFDAGTRCEDLRPFVYQDEVLISHVAYQPGTGKPVRQRLSKLRSDWSGIERWGAWDTVPHQRGIEKNWALLTDRHRDLYLVYLLDPLMIFRWHAAACWVPVWQETTDWADEVGQIPRCSTHLLPWRGGYLGWWHIQQDGIYGQGAYWLDANLRLTRRSAILLDGRDVQTDVYKPGVLYLSSWVDRGDDLWLFYGEGDAHSGVAVVKADDVDRELQ